jgi:hypothetical protein
MQFSRRTNVHHHTSALFRSAVFNLVISSTCTCIQSISRSASALSPGLLTHHRQHKVSASSSVSAPVRQKPRTEALVRVEVLNIIERHVVGQEELQKPLHVQSKLKFGQPVLVKVLERLVMPKQQALIKSNYFATRLLVRGSV